jgi:peptidoglycan/LPS O-acetylase OafA/YrhL
MPLSRTPDAAPARGTLRIEALTGLRAAAALFVVLSHLRAPDNAWLPVRTFFDAGYCGVTIFFILSGFVLAHNYAEPLRRNLSARSLWAYAVARIARIYPLYLVMLAWFVMPLLITGAPVPALAEHALMLQAWHPDGLVATYYNAPGWSLSVELFLYVCFPLIAIAGRPLGKHPHRLLIAMVVVFSVMGAITFWFNATGLSALPRLDPRGPHRWLYRSPLLRLGDFTLGVLAAEWVRSVAGQRWIRLAAPLALGV